MTRVEKGEFFDPPPNNCCGNIYYFNGQAAPRITITMKKGELLWFIQDGLSNSRMGYTLQNHPLYVSNQRTNPRTFIPSSMLNFYLNDKKVRLSEYVDNENFANALTRRVFFKPDKEGLYYVACWFHGVHMGTEINVT